MICGDGNEFRFLEHVRAKRGVGQLEDVVGSDQMKPWLVLVHGVEYRLEERMEQNGTSLIWFSHVTIYCATLFYEYGECDHVCE